jgi:YidC/Oxa1 family membrane protein insertase
MMKLYKEHGVNPLGGCLPMLLQMPVLFALFIVFRSTIQLRGKPFFLWINDLSAPDVLHLGVSLPLVGNSIHVLPILMGVTMIWQSKMSMTDPKQKMMIYFMPIFMIFIFYSLPSGLNLYYAVFNILSMIQTSQIKKKMHPGGNAGSEPTEDKAAIKQPVERNRKKSK